MIYYLGIDPGLRGAYSLIDSDGELHDVCDMPTKVTGTRKNGKPKESTDEEELARVLRIWSKDDELIAGVERVSAAPGAGGVSMFSFGEGYGKIQGVLAGLDIDCHLITPQSWKGALGLSSAKMESLDMARNQWPSFEESFKLVKHADRAEAALIGLYLSRWD